MKPYKGKNVATTTQIFPRVDDSPCNITRLQIIGFTVTYALPPLLTASVRPIGRWGGGGGGGGGQLGKSFVNLMILSRLRSENNLIATGEARRGAV